jgi:hypothetical protein
MKLNCPICQRQLHEVKKQEDARTLECFNQCTRLTYFHSKSLVRSYNLRINLDNKDYLFTSMNSISNEKYSILRVYGQKNDGYGYSTIAKLDQFFDLEEVFPNPKRIVKRLLNLRAFS